MENISKELLEKLVRQIIEEKLAGSCKIGRASCRERVSSPV